MRESRAKKDVASKVNLMTMKGVGVLDSIKCLNVHLEECKIRLEVRESRAKMGVISKLLKLSRLITMIGMRVLDSIKCLNVCLGDVKFDCNEIIRNVPLVRISRAKMGCGFQTWQVDSTDAI